MTVDFSRIFDPDQPLFWKPNAALAGIIFRLVNRKQKHSSPALGGTKKKKYISSSKFDTVIYGKEEVREKTRKRSKKEKKKAKGKKLLTNLALWKIWALFRWVLRSTHNNNLWFLLFRLPHRKKKYKRKFLSLPFPWI